MSQLKPLTYRISKIWGQPQGSVEKHTIDLPLDFLEEKDLQFSGHLKADLMLIRLKEELSVLLNNATVGLKFTCQLCLKPFIEKISILSAEREFLYNVPRNPQDEVDLFLIDTKAMTIDLSEMVRQEIILHFPLIPVCSKGCKGLCAVCGKNKNQTACKCKISAKIETYQPFKDLKKLVNTVKPPSKHKK